jgi:HSP20 family protein
MANIMKRESTPQASFGNVVDQIFQSNLSRFFDDDYWGFTGKLNRNQVPVNIRETDKGYEMELYAPGLKKEDFKLQLEGDTITVSFERKEEKKEENKKSGWLRQEFSMESFKRSFHLEESIDASKISARYESGVLYLSLPKKEHEQKLVRNISIE